MMATSSSLYHGPQASCPRLLKDRSMHSVDVSSMSTLKFSRCPNLRPLAVPRRLKFDIVRASAGTSATCSAIRATCQTEQQTIQNQSAVVSKTAPSQSKEAFVPKLDDGGSGGGPGGDDGGGGGGGGGGWGAGGFFFWGLLLLFGFIKNNERDGYSKKRRKQGYY